MSHLNDMERLNQNPESSSDVYARPIIPLLISLICGLTIGMFLPEYDIWIYPFAGLIFAIIIFQVIKKKAVMISPLLFFSSLGYLLIQPFIAPDHPSNHVTHYLDKQKWQITGIVDKDPVIKNHRMRCILNVRRLDSKDRHNQVVGKIRVTITGKEFPVLLKGDKVTFASRIRSIRNFNNPGGFNYERYMAFKKIFGTAYVRAGRLIILEKNQAMTPFRAISRYRNDMSSMIDTTLSGDPKKILNALITGKRSQIDRSLAEQFNRAGLGHLLAISGLHIGIVASVSFLFFIGLLSRFEFFLWHAWTKKGAAMLSVFPVLLYGLLAGMSPSTQRAVIMVSVFLMTFLFEKEQDSINSLAVAALVILIVTPHALFSISFQLSFIAVFFIIYGLPKQGTAPLSKESGWIDIKNKISQFLIVSLLAIIGTLPLVMHYFNQISLVGFFSNLIGIPIIGFIVVPIGIASAFLYPFSHFLSSLGIMISGGALKLVLMVIYTISSLPFAAVKTITPNLFEISCFYILLWSILTLIKTPVIKKMETSFFSTRKVSWTLAILCTTALFGDAGYHLYQRGWHKNLDVTILDVGQGNAALLELPKGHTMLIDGGGFSNNSIFDIGERVVAPFLWRKKITTIDTLVLSHPNTDHLNGLTYIARHFHVKRVWSNSETVTTESYKKFIKVIREKNISLPQFETITRKQVISGVTFEILYPPEDFLHKQKMGRRNNTNNNSLVLKVTFGKTSFIFPGDIMAEGERALVRTSPKTLKSTALLAPHHGSRTSNTSLFLNEINPEVVVVSCGWKNRFHMPHSVVLDRYRNLDITVYRTDHHGAVSLTSDGQTLKVGRTIGSGADSDEFFQPY